MTVKISSYRQAMVRFAAVTGSPLSQCFEGPLEIARFVGLAPTSGYRAVAQAEAAGLLTRDPKGTYLRGEDACRIGLSAFGYGEFAVAGHPVLTHLRQATRMTSFLGIIADYELTIGPFSFGRGPDFVVPTSGYRLSDKPLWMGDDPIAVTLLPTAEHGRKQTALIAYLDAKSSENIAIVGVLLPTGQTNVGAEQISHILTAKDRFLQAVDGDQ